MGLTVEIEKSLLEDYTREIARDYTKALEICATEFVVAMLDRTEKGQDVDGNKFAEYQGSYREQIEQTGKVQVGRNRYRSKALNPVNLLVTGKMLNSINYKVAKNGRSVKIFIPRAQARKARGIQEGNRFIKNKRKFFEISEKEKDKFLETFKQNLRLFKDE
jgi:hypothetical protein